MIIIVAFHSSALGLTTEWYDTAPTAMHPLLPDRRATDFDSLCWNHADPLQLPSFRSKQRASSLSQIHNNEARAY